MTKLLIILLFGLACETVGVILLKQGLSAVGPVPSVSVAGVVHVIKAGATNPKVWLGMFFEAVFFGALVFLMSQADISFIWPLTALGFVFMTFAAQFVLKDPVTPTRWTGVVLIVAGAILIGYSEQTKEKATSRPTVNSPAAEP